MITFGQGFSCPLSALGLRAKLVCRRSCSLYQALINCSYEVRVFIKNTPLAAKGNRHTRCFICPRPCAVKVKVKNTSKCCHPGTTSIVKLDVHHARGRNNRQKMTCPFVRRVVIYPDTATPSVAIQTCSLLGEIVISLTLLASLSYTSRFLPGTRFSA